MHDWVRRKLAHQRWSPEQMAARLRAMHPDNPCARVSHETIYAAIYAQPKGGLKAAMVLALRQAKPARGRKRTTLAGSSMVPDSLRIIHRPEEIEARLLPGHWEGDLIKGAFNRSSVGTLVERKTRFVFLCKIEGNTAVAALEAFSRQMKRLPREVRKSMTYDRGGEGLLRSSPQSMAARHEREHQRPLAAILPEGYRPVAVDLPRDPSRSSRAEQQAPKNAWLEDTK